MPEIVILKGKAEISRISLFGNSLSVGRDPSNGIVVDDPRVSRKHARIFRENDDFIYEDVGSTMGSLFSGKEVSRHVFSNGDTIELGQSSLVFVAIDGDLVDIEASTPGPDKGSLKTWPNLGNMLDKVDESGESSRLLKALFEISLELDSAEEFDDVLTRIMDKALVMMGGERGFIMLRDLDSGQLRLHSARDTQGEITGVNAEGVSKSLMEKVLNTGEPVLIDNAMDPEMQTRSMVMNHIHSAMCVPLKNGNEVAGVIYADHRSRSSAFTDTDLAFFTTFAIQAKAAIDSSRAYWKLVDGLFSASGDFVAVCSPEGRITRANKGALELLGLASSEIEGRPIESIVAATDQPAALVLVQKITSSGRAQGETLQLQHSDGRLIAINLSGFVMRDRQGSVQGLCLIGRDLTNEMKLIAHLKSVTARLFEVNNMKSEFVGMISHELKGPLTVILGFADMLRKSPDMLQNPEKTSQRLTQIMLAGERANTLIGELLELNQLETGRTDLKVARLDVIEILNASVQGLALSAQKNNITVTITTPEKTPQILADANLIRRVFDNLISNGIKYNKNGGKLAISILVHAGQTEFRFKDEGVGLSANDQKNVFTQFFRSANTAQSHKGTGLGLSIVKAIVERHGGTLSLESELGNGTTYITTLLLEPPKI
ncbi:MAG: hypothetical protein COB53_01770 [Elusimicrobia bacterium]|nr:MAG: hypothetical protein COB53_01770 [Elusimicrobiota bacterium]